MMYHECYSFFIRMIDGQDPVDVISHPFPFVAIPVMRLLTLSHIAWL